MSADFVWHMEDVLDLYSSKLDDQFPVVCIDESPHQLISDVYPVIGPESGIPLRRDFDYKRNGTVNLFVVSQPLAGWCHVEVTEQRTAVDYAHFMKLVADEYFPTAGVIRVVQDNLNTHSPASFYKAFSPEEARRLTQRFEFHYTPKHGSWLNIAEIEFSVLTKQCLGDRRLGTIDLMRSEVEVWERGHNTEKTPIHWRFTTADARKKLTRLYPT